MINSYLVSLAHRIAAPLAAFISTFALVAGALALPATAFASPTMLYVSESAPVAVAPATDTGTPTRPYHTIQQALNVALPHQTIIVEAGTYNQNIEVPVSNLTIKGVDGPVILNLASGFGIDLDEPPLSATNFTLSGFTVNASPSTTYALKAYKADGLTLKNDTFNGGEGNTGGGVDVNTTSNVLIDTVTSTGFHKNGFAITSAFASGDTASNNVTFNNITSTGNGWTGISFYSVGNDHSPTSVGGSASITGVKFTGSDTISNNAQGGIFVEGDSDAHFGANSTPANTVTTDGTTLDLTHVAFSGNPTFDVVNYQTAPVNAIGATFGGTTGDNMTAAERTSEDAKIDDQLDHAALGLVTYYTPVVPVTPSTVTVTIEKFIDGKMATAATANNTAFPMMSTWVTTNFPSGSGTYPLGPAGFDGQGVPYQAMTAQQNLGSSYTTNEDTSGSIVGASCTVGDPYALVGYSTGATEAAAASSTVSLTPPQLTNLQSNQYIIVWNKPCLPAPVLVSPASGSTSTSAAQQTIDWTDVTDGIGPSTYEYESSLSNATNADGSFVTPVFQSGVLSDSQISTPNTPDGVYYFHMKALDADGNMSPWSTTYTVTVADSVTPPADTMPPVVSVTPIAGSDLSGTVTFDITVTDNNPLDPTKNKNVWVYLYNSAAPQASGGAKVDLSSGTGTFTVDTTKLANGDAWLDVGQVFDAAGNANGPTDNYFKDYTINNSNDGGTVTPPTDTTAPSVPMNLSFSDPDALACGSSTAIPTGTSLWDASTDDTGVTGYDYYVTTPGTHNASNPYIAQTTTNSLGGDFNEGDGVYTFKVDAFDAAGNHSAYSNTCSITYTGPTGNNDQSGTLTATPLNVSTPEDTQLLINLAATGGDGSALTYTYTQPATGGGTVTGTGPEVTYTPAASSTAPDSFTYTVSDDNSTSTPATVSITIGGDSDGGGITPPAGGPTVSNGSTNIAENAVNAAITLTSSVQGAVTFNIVTPTEHGTLSVPANGQVLYTPNKNYTGPDSFQFSASDAGGTGNTATYTIMVTEGTQIVPTATAQSVDATSGVPANITLGATDADAKDSFTFATSSSPTHGTLTGSGVNLVYTPASDFTGKDSFNFTASDETSTSTEAAVTITVTAPAPVTPTPTVTPTFFGGGGGGGGLSGGILHNFTSGGTGGAGGSAGNAGNGGQGSRTGNGGQVLGASTYNFTKNFGIGTHDEDVTQLQLILIANGDLKITTPTGYFGSLTKAAVKAYQAAHNITPMSGYVGPITRALLNDGTV